LGIYSFVKTTQPAIAKLKFTFNQTKPTNKQTNTMTTTQTYATRAEAQKVIVGLNSGTYYLAHGEYERPDYTARKIRSGDRYYIHARRYFYAGTLHAKKSGPLTVYDLDSI
jgi:hypothetical protein